MMLVCYNMGRSNKIQYIDYSLIARLLYLSTPMVIAARNDSINRDA